VPTPVAALQEKVVRYVEDLIGRHEVNEYDEIHFRWGSVHVFLKCRPYGEEDTLVSINVPLLHHVPATPELFRHVAMHADDWYFGHLSATRYDGDDAHVKLWLSHTLLGDYLDVEELKSALAAVANTADGLDEDLKASFGGERHHED
jgi:hypothetical protein